MFFCTTSDKNYLVKGLALYQSIERFYGKEFKIYWLCLDDETFDFFTKGKGTAFACVHPIPLKSMEGQDSMITQARKNPGTQWADSNINFIWCITPYFIWWVLQYFLDSTATQLMYIDSDILFYQHPQKIFDAVGYKDIGIHTHRFTPPRKWTEVGWYNVGVMVFKNNKPAAFIANNWMRWCLAHPAANPYYQDYGTTGDQKYLELIEKKWPESICVFDEGTGISHLAPWCTHIDEEKDMCFFHFSHFQFIINSMNYEWRDSMNGEWNPSALQHIKPYYINYFQTLKQLHSQCLC